MRWLVLNLADIDEVVYDFPQSLLVNVRIISELGCSHFHLMVQSSILAESLNDQAASVYSAVQYYCPLHNALVSTYT
jgi:hypothetical protein